MLLFFMRTLTPEAATAYRYTDKKGTVVFTDDLKKIPPDFRKDAKRIDLPEPEESQKPEGTPRKIFKKIKEKAAEKKLIQKGRKFLSTLLKDQRFWMAGFIAGGIILFFIASYFLKRLVGSFVSRVLIRLFLVVALASGVYVLYLSWISKKIFSFNEQISGSKPGSNKKGLGKIVTPGDIIEKAKEAVDQINATIKNKEKKLEEIGNE